MKVLTQRLSRSKSETNISPFSVKLALEKRCSVLKISTGWPVNGAFSINTLSRCGTLFFGSPLSNALTHVRVAGSLDRKSTRLNSSHSQISYAVFCLKKKKKKKTNLILILKL